MVTPYKDTLGDEFNTTDIFLDSTNGYFNKITNFQGRVTGIYSVSAINVTSSAAIIAAYPIFATAIVVDQVGSDSSTPPPGGGNSGYHVSNHTIEYYQWYQRDEIQEWFNFTYWYYYNSTDQLKFVCAYWNNTVEVPTSLYSAPYVETHFDAMFGTWNSQNPQPIGTSLTNYTDNNESWSFSIYNWKDTNENPIGFTAWENDSIGYYPAGYEPEGRDNY